MMESYAYLHLALSYENPNLGIPHGKLSGQGYRWFLSLAVMLAVLSITQTAQAILAIGDFGSEVTQVQNRLRELGYLSANSTGYFGEETQNAVIQFQRDNNLAQDGIVGPNTVAVLASGTRPTVRPAVNTTPVSDRQLVGLGVGDSGPGVTSLQNRLQSLGFFNANPTGYFGTITRDAVVSFQQANAIAATGLVTEETLAILNRGTQSLAGNVSLGPGSFGPVVGLVQQELQRLGFFRGPITNFYDDVTFQAVRNFQMTYGLTPTGYIGPTTQNRLVSQRMFVPGNSTVSSSPISSSSMNSSNPPSILVVGSRGTDVITLQRRLQQLGYYTGMIDGVFGESTRIAVLRFQRDNGITPTGQVGTTTQFYLARVIAQPSMIPVVSQSTATVVRPIVTTPTTSMSMGNAGEDVRKVQRRLRDLGFYNGPINGFFDNNTQNAVIRFQQAYGITTTGIVGPTTENYLFNVTSSSFGNPSFGNVMNSNMITTGPPERPVNVMALQERLRIQGLYTGPVDGVYNTQMESAIAQARQLYGVSADDILYSGF